jgi:hypothetical protein
VVSGGELIPKRKPDNTTVVRFELQDTERAMLESFLMTWQVGKVASSLDQLLSLENAYLAVTIYEILTGKEVLPGTPNDIYKLIDWVRDYFKANPEEEFGTVKDLFETLLQKGTIGGQFGLWDWLD